MENATRWLFPVSIYGAICYRFLLLVTEPYTFSYPSLISIYIYYIYITFTLCRILLCLPIRPIKMVIIFASFFKMFAILPIFRILPYLNCFEHIFMLLTLSNSVFFPYSLYNIIYIIFWHFLVISCYRQVQSWINIVYFLAVFS